MIFVRTLILVVLVSLVSSCSRSPTTVALPTTVSTAIAGYPFAVQIKNEMGGDANLTAVIVDFDRQGDQFNIPQITYGFSSPQTNGRVFAITVDNMKRQVFAALDAPSSPDSPFMPSFQRMPLDLGGITNDIAEILQIAKTNGLDEFYALTSSTNRNVGLRLFNSEAGPIWSVIGDGWDEKGPIADLAIRIDARTGKVISHSIQKAVNRP